MLNNHALKSVIHRESVLITFIVTGVAAFITLCIWGGLFDKGLSKELAIQETITNEWAVSKSNLGYSYW